MTLEMYTDSREEAMKKMPSRDEIVTLVDEIEARLSARDRDSLKAVSSAIRQIVTREALARRMDGKEAGRLEAELMDELNQRKFDKCRLMPRSVDSLSPLRPGESTVEKPVSAGPDYPRHFVDAREDKNEEIHGEFPEKGAA